MSDADPSLVPPATLLLALGMVGLHTQLEERGGSLSIFGGLLWYLAPRLEGEGCWEVTHLFGDRAYRSEALASKLAGEGISLVTERSRQNGKRQQVEVAFSALKWTFGIEHTRAKTLVGLATRIVAKIAAYTYAFFVNRMLDRPQGRIRELWA